MCMEFLKYPFIVVVKRAIIIVILLIFFVFLFEFYKYSFIIVVDATRDLFPHGQRELEFLLAHTAKKF